MSIWKRYVNYQWSILEPIFLDTGYGFRPDRSAYGAIRKALVFYKQGYIPAVDIDFVKIIDFSDIGIIFDSLSKDMLISFLRE
jgi:retron-type reverse transcriptase